jgi:hypothetical protein
VRRLGIGLFSTLMLLALAAGSAFGFTGTLDQENGTNPDGYEGAHAPGFFGQTFTAGMDGYLTEVELSGRFMSVPAVVAPNATSGNLYVKVFATSGGLPTGSALGSTTTEVGSTDGWITITFAAPIPITSGTMYALQFNMDPGVGLVFGNAYAGGTKFSGNGTDAPMIMGGDWAFRTYVSESAPATLPPTGTGASGSGSGTSFPILAIVGALAGIGAGSLAIRRHAVGVR